MGLTKDGRVVVYMGDDKGDECFYQFISTKKYNPMNREANFDILENGTLYVANLSKQKWVALDYATNSALQSKFTEEHSLDAICIYWGTTTKK